MVHFQSPGSAAGNGDGVDRPLAIVTGGSSGIGLAAAGELARRGCRIALLARDRDRLAEAAGRLAADGAVVVTGALDVRERAAVEETVGELIAAFGPPLWLVTSAGIVEPGFFLAQDVALTQEQVATNFLGTAYVVRAAAPAMAAAGRGHVVLVSSGAGLFGVAGYAGYCASKFAVLGLAEVLRIELSQSGVGVTVATPPDTATPQLDYEMSRRPAVIAAFAGAGRPLSADEVARHMIRCAERGRFLSTPGWRLATLAQVRSLVFDRLAAVQMGHLRRARRTPDSAA